MSSVVVLDNGGGLCKAGFGGERDPVAVVPNCLGRSSTSKKWLVADQLQGPDADVTSVSVRRPLDRGYLVNPDLQRDVWDHVLRSLLRADPAHSSLLLVEPLFNPPSIQRATDELIFEDFGFRSLCVADSPSLVHLYEASRLPHLLQSCCSLVVDCGFSFTHAAPVLQNFTLNYGVRRLDLGGKALTNYLKELVSYRSVNVMDETLIVDHAKEQLCFVSLDVPRDLQLARKSGKDNPFKCTYVLPDGVTHTKGYVKDMGEAQRFLSLPHGTIEHPVANGELDFRENGKKLEDRRHLDLTKNEFSLTNERFLVPEMIFHPSDLVLKMKRTQAQIKIKLELFMTSPALQHMAPLVNPAHRLRFGVYTENPLNSIILCFIRFQISGAFALVDFMVLNLVLWIFTGMNQAGLAECVVRAVQSCHPHLHPLLFESIILTGGSTLFPQFRERLEIELRPLVRDDYKLKITSQEDPILGVWRGGSLLASSPDFESMCVTKLEYEEIGSARSRRRFFH